MFFKKSKLKNVVVAYDTVTKQVLFFQREKYNDDGLISSKLGEMVALGYRPEISLTSAFEFVRLVKLLEVISGLRVEQFYCRYDNAYLFS